MAVQPIPLRDIHAIFAPRDPAASLRASATTFEALGHTFSADFCRQMADDAALWPALYSHWALEQAARAERLLGEAK